MKKIILIPIMVMMVVMCSLTASAVQLSRNVTSVVNTTGITDAGDKSSFFFKGDNSTYNVSEVIDVPGFDVRLNFTNVTEKVAAYHFNLYALYDGHTGHYIEIQLLNFSDGVWTKIGVIGKTTDFTWYNNTVMSQNFISGNVMAVRIYHYTTGNPNDDIYFDYFVMIESHIPPLTEVYEVGKCPVDDIPTTLLFIFIGGFLAFMFYIGDKSRVPIFNIVTGIAIIFYSFPLWGCYFVYGATVMVFGILVLLYSWKWKWQLNK